MRDTDLYAQILGLRSPWRVAEVELLRDEGEVRVQVVPEAGVGWACPQCGRPSPGYDSRSRAWRHLVLFPALDCISPAVIENSRSPVNAVGQ